MKSGCYCVSFQHLTISIYHNYVGFMDELLPLTLSLCSYFWYCTLVAFSGIPILNIIIIYQPKFSVVCADSYIKCAMMFYKENCMKLSVVY